jgi:2-amino-4-hydroxy-6-hydroxymethyldihydropteridine diphosphokinase
MTKAYIGVGSNIDPEANIEKALELLIELVKVTGISSFYKTKPLQNKKINYFLNGVWQISTNFSPEQLKYNVLKKIEKELHREQDKDKYSSRTIDLDLLLFGEMVFNNERMVIPDPDIYIRPFIIIPLFELDPELLLPDSGKLIKDLNTDLDNNQLELMKKFSENLKNKIRKNKER